MKKIFLLALLTAGLAFQSCSDDDDLTNVPENISTAFQQKYPNITVTEWEKQGTGYKADFWNNGAEAEAWFAADGSWIRTETDVPNPNANLPQPIRDYVTATYAGYYIEDADFVETTSQAYYEVELERQGSADIYLNIKADGTLIK